MRSINQQAAEMNAGIAALVNATVNPPVPDIDRSALLAAVAQPEVEVETRPTIHLQATVLVFRRDSWTCR